MPSTPHPQALVIGASRGLGLALARQLVHRDWHVIATARQNDGALRSAADQSGGRLVVEHLDMTQADELKGLRRRLADGRLDLLFVNAAVNIGTGSIDEASTETFAEVMITNALSPLRVLAALRDLVVEGGTVAVMSSEQGSVTLNTEPGFELYKASKAALNQLMRSYATRHADDGHTKLLIDPGHNQTELGGPGAPLSPDETMPAVAAVIEAQTGAPGLRFLDRFGQAVPW